MSSADPSGLLAWDFLLSVAYGAICIPLYCLTIGMILTSQKHFQGSFFRIYAVNGILNVIYFFNKFFIMRFPFYTCLNCLLSQFLTTFNGTLLTIMYFFHWHMGYVNFLLPVVLSFDRLVVVLLNIRINQIWRKSYIYFVLFGMLFPLIFTQNIIRCTSFYEYIPASDNYKIEFDANRALMYGSTAAVMFSSSFVSLMLNVLVLIGLSKLNIMSRDVRKKAEGKLLINCFVSTTMEIVITSSTLIQQFYTSEYPIIFTITRLINLFVADAFILLPPFVLLYSSGQLRKETAKSLSRKSPTIYIGSSVNSHN